MGMRLSQKIGSPVLMYAGGEYESTTSYTIGAATTAPTPGAGATFYRRTVRDGGYAIVRWEYNQTVAGSGGSGLYRLPMAANLTIDLAKLAVSGVVNNISAACGSGGMQINSTQFNCVAIVVNATNIGLAVDIQGASGTSIADWGSSSNGLGNNVVRFAIEVRVPIVGWDSYIAQGAGLATATTPGLFRKYVAPTSLTIADFGSQTGCTIDAGDVPANNNKWWQLNDTVYVSFYVDTFSTTAVTTFSFQLSSAIPRPLANQTSVCIVYDNNGTTPATAQIQVNTGGVVAITKIGSAFATSTNNSYFRAQINWSTI